MIIHELTVKNFRSIGNKQIVLNFNSKDSTLIVGENHDSIVNDAIDSNGSGKSSLLIALLYCIYGKIAEEIKLDDLINNINKKDLEVSCIIERNNMYYKIIRFRKNKSLGGTGVKFYKSDKLVDLTSEKNEFTLDSTKSENDEITKLLGIPFHIFNKIIVFSASGEHFFDLPATSTSTRANQRDILEEIFGYVELSEKAESIKEQLDIFKKEYNSKKIVCDALIIEEKKHELSISQLESQIADWDSTKSSRLEELHSSLTSFKKIDYTKQADIITKNDLIKNQLLKLEYDLGLKELELKNIIKANSTNTARIDEYHKKYDDLSLKIKELHKIDFVEELKLHDLFDQYQKDKQILERQIQTLENSIFQVQDKLTKNETEITELRANHCPYCKQQFNATELKLQELVIDNEKLNTSLQNDTLELEMNKSILRNLTIPKFSNTRAYYISAQQKLESYKTELDNLIKPSENIQDTTELNSLIQDIQDQIKNIDKPKKCMFEDLNALNISKNSKIKIETELSILEKQTNPHLKTIENIRQNKPASSQTIAEQMAQIEYEINHYDLLYKLLTKKDSFLRKKLLDKNLPLLNNRLKEYLDKLGLPHRVKFNNDMSATISQFSTSIDYKALSSGQKARINLGLMFAFRDVLQTRHEKVNICILDECLDVGLGTVGVQLAVKTIKEIAKEQKINMYVISHRDEVKSQFKRHIKMVLKNGMTEISE